MKQYKNDNIANFVQLWENSKHKEMITSPIALPSRGRCGEKTHPFESVTVM